MDDNDFKITNNKFINNKAAYGGAVYVRYATEMNNCQFIANTATNYGGAVHWDVSYGKITNSSFTNNKAPSGGAIYWYSSYGEVNNSTFENNTATGDGGAIYWHGNNEKLTSSSFTGNNAKNGGAVYGYDESTNGQIIDCRFTQNTATEKGGSINWQGSGKNNQHLIYKQQCKRWWNKFH